MAFDQIPTAFFIEQSNSSHHQMFSANPAFCYGSSSNSHCSQTPALFQPFAGFQRPLLHPNEVPSIFAWLRTAAIEIRCPNRVENGVCRIISVLMKPLIVILLVVHGYSHGPYKMAIGPLKLFAARRHPLLQSSRDFFSCCWERNFTWEK